MRLFEDPFNQENLLILLRQGHTLSESMKLMGKGFDLGKLRRERQADPTFDEKVFMAQAAAFSPVVKRIVEQATYGDQDDPITVKAQELAIRHYNKALDREHRHAIVEHQWDRQNDAAVNRTPGLPSPDKDMIIDLIAAIKEGSHEIEEQAGGDEHAALPEAEGNTGA